MNDPNNNLTYQPLNNETPTSNFNNINNNNSNIQNNGFNQNKSQTINQPINNNINKQSINQQQVYNQENNTQNNVSLNTNNIQKSNKFKIIGIIAVIIIVVLVVIMSFSSNSSSGNGYTVEYGETLKINELEGYYNFEIEVLSVEKNYLIDEVFHSGECLAMKVKIKNNSTEDLEIIPLMMKFNLLDSSNNEISSLNIALSSTMTNALKEIPSGQETSGYFYFFDVNDDGKTTNIKNNDIARLEIEVMKHMEKEDSVVSGDYEQYYINLK